MHLYRALSTYLHATHHRSKLEPVLIALSLLTPCLIFSESFLNRGRHLK
jgi:hypothetical protein